MNINKLYSKEYSLYLRRLNRQLKAGYDVNVIPKVENPTKKDITLIKSIRATQIKKESDIVNLITGEIVSENKKEIDKINREFLALPAELQDISMEHGQLINNVNTDVYTAIIEYDLLINNWYDSLYEFRKDLRDFLFDRTNELLSNESSKLEFAIAYKKNPDIFPTPADSRIEVVSAKMNAVMEAMQFYSDSPEINYFADRFINYE
nr:MAG TPA: hypothetical protein [Caudoviricetes sp.]